MFTILLPHVSRLTFSNEQLTQDEGKFHRHKVINKVIGPGLIDGDDDGCT